MLTVNQAASIRAQVIFELAQLLGVGITAIRPELRLIDDLRVDCWARRRLGEFRPRIDVRLPLDPGRYVRDEICVVVNLPLGPQYCYHAPPGSGVSRELSKGPHNDDYFVNYEEHGFPQTVDSVITACLIAAAYQLGRFERRVPSGVHASATASPAARGTSDSELPSSESLPVVGFGLEVSEEVQKEIQAAALHARQRWDRAQEFLYGPVKG